MRKRGKVQLSLIANERSRKTTFMKRKKGMMKKLHELTTLCGVQACGVIYSPYQSVPEAWPSREGVERVASKFMEMPMNVRTKTMMDQETYLRESITKGKAQVEKLALENRELQARQFMFNCLEGKMSEYHYGARDLHDLQQYINHYIYQLTHRIKILGENGESSSFSHFPAAVANTYLPIAADFPIVTDATVVTTPSGFSDQNQYEPVQYQTHTDLYDQHGIYNMNLNLNMNLDSNHNLNQNLDLSPNQYPTQQQSFIDLLMEQRMNYAGGQSNIPFMDENHYQLPIYDLAITSHMSSITATTSTTSVYAPYINNNI